MHVVKRRSESRYRCGCGADTETRGEIENDTVMGLEAYI